MEKHLWGPTIWFFLHGTAEKINPDKFADQKQNLFKILDIVCSNLPCPDCSEHALQEIKKINIANVTTRDIYKELLLTLHNRVNIRLKKSQFSREQLDEKYKSVNLKGVMHNFNIAYNKSIYNEKAFHDTLRKRLQNAELYKCINLVLAECI